MEVGAPAATRPKHAAGQRMGRARTKPERLTDLVDAGKSYAPAERRPGDGSSRYAGVSRTVDAVTFRVSWCAQHDGRDCGSFDDVKVAARAYDFARHCHGKPAVNFDGSGEGGETFCAYCEDWELRAVADRDEKPLIEKYGRRFFEDPDHPGEIYVVQTGVQWSGVAPSVTVDAVGQDAEEGAITYLLNDELRKMIAATPQGLMIQRSANADPAPQPKLSELSELRESPPPKTPSRKRPRPDDDAMAAENTRLRKELDSLRTATQSLERDLRACEARADRSEARADRYGRQRDDARGDVDDLRRDVKRLRRERDEARQDATSSERALAAMRHKFDRQVAAQRDDATPARPGKPKKSAARRAAKSAAKPAATMAGDALAALPPAATAASPGPPVELPAASAVPPYPVDALVEARWRGGSKFYPAIVLAVGNNGETQTVDIEYCDDSDQELGLPVEFVRPANRRLLQRYQQCINQIVAALLDGVALWSAPDSLLIYAQVTKNSQVNERRPQMFYCHRRRRRRRCGALLRGIRSLRPGTTVRGLRRRLCGSDNIQRESLSRTAPRRRCRSMNSSRSARPSIRVPCRLPR